MPAPGNLRWLEDVLHLPRVVPAPEDPDAEITRWYPWEPEESSLNDLWFRRVIFWPDEVTTP